MPARSNLFWFFTNKLRGRGEWNISKRHFSSLFSRKGEKIHCQGLEPKSLYVSHVMTYFVVCLFVLSGHLGYSIMLFAFRVMLLPQGSSLIECFKTKWEPVVCNIPNSYPVTTLFAGIQRNCLEQSNANST